MGERTITDRVFKELVLLERHIQILKLVKQESPIGIMKLSQLLEVPSHKIRYSLRVLEKEGFLIATIDGAIATEKGDKALSALSKNLDEIIVQVKKTKESLKS